MHAWIDLILKPYTDKIDVRILGRQHPVIILDAYHVHEMGLIVNFIQLMAIEVLHIWAPGRLCILVSAY